MNVQVDAGAEAVGGLAAVLARVCGGGALDEEVRRRARPLLDDHAHAAADRVVGYYLRWEDKQTIA